MKAELHIKLERPVRGKQFTHKTIIATKSQIDGAVADFIFERINDTRLVKAVSIAVNMFDAKGCLVKDFVYRPTYR